MRNEQECFCLYILLEAILLNRLRKEGVDENEQQANK